MWINGQDNWPSGTVLLLAQRGFATLEYFFFPVSTKREISESRWYIYLFGRMYQSYLVSCLILCSPESICVINIYWPNILFEKRNMGHMIYLWWPFIWWMVNWEEIYGSGCKLRENFLALTSHMQQSTAHTNSACLSNHWWMRLTMHN